MFLLVQMLQILLEIRSSERLRERRRDENHSRVSRDALTTEPMVIPWPRGGPDSGKVESHISGEFALPVFHRGREVNRWINGGHPG